MKRVLAGVAAIAAATAFADYTYYVRQNGGSDSNSGTSYEKAFASYKKALKTVQGIADSIPKTIYIYPGEYHVAKVDASGNPVPEDQVVPSGRPGFHFIGVDDDGTGDVRTPADPKKVVLDGDNVMRILTSYNSDGMHFRNMTLQNGLSLATGGRYYYFAGSGGLVYIAGSNNIFSNCIFRHGIADKGGAIYGSGAMKNAVCDCKFYDCAATNSSGGGAVYLAGQNHANKDDNQTYVRCDFVNCRASNASQASGEAVMGGALTLTTPTAGTNGFCLVSCNFVSNSCSGIGGALGGPVLYATNCTFVGNVANCDGSVNYPIVYGTTMVNRTNNYVDCTFVGNVAKAMSGGDTIDVSRHIGGMLVNYSNYATTLRKCVIADNLSYGFIGVLGRRDTGGVNTQMYDTIVTNNLIKGDVLEPIAEASKTDLKLYNYSGVIKSADGSIVSNCVISGNSSYGGGYVLTLGTDSKVYDSVITDNVGKECGGKTGLATVWGGALTMAKRCLVRNCLISRNWRQAASGICAVIYGDSVANSSNRVENCTICDNIARADPNWYSVGPRLSGAGSAIVNSVCLGNKTEAGREVNMCLQDGAVESNCYTTVETSETYKDPRFRDRANGDYRLKRASPLRDAGQPLDWMTEGTKDLAGQGRVNGEKPDIGCYEYWWYSTGMLLFVR